MGEGCDLNFLDIFNKIEHTGQLSCPSPDDDLERCSVVRLSFVATVITGV